MDLEVRNSTKMLIFAGVVVFIFFLWINTSTTTTPRHSIAVNHISQSGLPPATTISFTPTYTSSIGKEFVTGSTQFTLTTVGGDGGEKSTAYRINSGSWTLYTTPFTLGSSSNGTYIISYNSTANGGEVEGTNTDNVFIDKNPPTTSASWIPGTVYMASNGEQFIANPNVWNENFNEYTTGQDFCSPSKNGWSSLTSGGYVDPTAKTVGSSMAGDWVDSGTAAVACINMPSGQGSGWNMVQGQFCPSSTTITAFPCDLTSNDNVFGIRLNSGSIYVFNEGTLMTAVQSFNANTWTYFRVWWNDATYKFYVQISIDNLAWTTYNNNNSYYVWNIYGNLAPNRDYIESSSTGSLAMDNLGIFYYVAITLNGTDNIGGSGIASTHYKLYFNGVETIGWSSYTSPITLTNNGNATWTIYYSSIDNVGNNQSTPVMQDVFLDTIAPATTISFTPIYTSGTNKSWVNSSTHFTLSAHDNSGGSGLAATYYEWSGDGRQSILDIVQYAI